MTQLLFEDPSRIGMLLFNTNTEGDRHLDRLVTQPMESLGGMDLFLKYGDQAFAYSLSKEKTDPETQARQQKLDAQENLSEKVGTLGRNIKAQVDELCMLVFNFGGSAYLHAPLDKDGKPKGRPKFTINEHREGFSLLKRTAPPETIKPHVAVQRLFGLKRMTLDRVIEGMKKRIGNMRTTVDKSQAKLQELIPYARTSNLLMQRSDWEGTTLQLCVFHPNLHKRSEKDEYLVPVKDFSKEIKERSKGKSLVFELILNMNAVKRVIVTAADLLSPRTIGVGDEDIAMKLIGLGELKIFSRLRAIFGQERDQNCVSLLSIPNLANFRITLTEGAVSNTSRPDPLYCLVRKLFHHLVHRILTEPAGEVNSRLFVQECHTFIRERFNFVLFRHFVSTFLKAFYDSPHVLLNKIQISIDRGCISMELYSECHSIAAEYRRYMFIEKLLFLDCTLVSKNLADKFTVAQVQISEIGQYINMLLRFLFS